MEIRTCKKCSETKNLEDFEVYDRARGYRRHECRSCTRARLRRHYEQHLSHRLRAAHQRYSKDPYHQWAIEKREQTRRNGARRYAQIRDQVFNLYGRECVACGETERMFLTIDHINNDGWEKRKGPGGYRESGIGLYLDILRHGMREDLEILCFNCNFGKRRNDGKLVVDRRRKERCNDHPERE